MRATHEGFLQEKTMITPLREYGNAGEEAALHHLVREGYHLLERNWRVGHLEVDIIAEQFGMLIFVEVKSRRHASADETAEAVDHNKQGKILEAARLYCQERRLSKPIRFDIITVTGETSPFTIQHITDAFSADSYARVERSRS